MFGVIIESFKEWSKDNASELAAAIAYYTIFSIAPLLVIAIAIAGYFFSRSTAQNQLLSQVSGVVGPQTAGFLITLMQNTNRTSNGIIPTIISIIVLLLGASGIFLQIQYALNKIWDVPQTKGGGIMRTLKQRLNSFLMVLGIGFLFLLFLLLSAAVSILTNYINISPQNKALPQIINLAVLFILMTILFAMVYRFVPDKEISWKDVWLGASVTSLLFVLGRYAIGLYLTISKTGAAYGAAGSLIVLLIWIYYSAQIFLLGAEFTQVFARKYGSHKEPTPTKEAPSMQKIPPLQESRQS